MSKYGYKTVTKTTTEDVAVDPGDGYEIVPEGTPITPDMECYNNYSEEWSKTCDPCRGQEACRIQQSYLSNTNP